MKFISTLFLLVLIATNLFAQKQKVWLDADTGNEMDDLYAIVRLVEDPSVELVGISSAHFNNPDLLVFEKWNAYDTKANFKIDKKALADDFWKVLKEKF